MSTSEVIGRWAGRITGPGFVLGLQVVQLQQGSGAADGVAMHAVVRVGQDNQGTLAGDGSMTFSDRMRASQTFDAQSTDAFKLRLTRDGTLTITNLRWGGTQEIRLTDLGEGVLQGWGAAIGGRSGRALWLLCADGRAIEVPR